MVLGRRDYMEVVDADGIGSLRALQQQFATGKTGRERGEQC